MLPQKLLGFLLWVIYRTWISTWRVKIVEHPELRADHINKSPRVLAFWHGDELTMLALSRNYKVVTMVSSSRDGEIMATATRLLGMKATRGSSTRGGARALLALIKVAESGVTPILAVDGPTGPYHKVKSGVFLLAKKLDAKIYPAGVDASRAWIFKNSWNKAALPLPFSRVVVVWGEPLTVRDEPDSILAERLERLLDAARHSASKVIASK